jgi:ribosomal protein L6P/L9E
MSQQSGIIYFGHGTLQLGILVWNIEKGIFWSNLNYKIDVVFAESSKTKMDWTTSKKNVNVTQEVGKSQMKCYAFCLHSFYNNYLRGKELFEELVRMFTIHFKSDISTNKINNDVNELHIEDLSSCNEIALIKLHQIFQYKES